MNGSDAGRYWGVRVPNRCAVPPALLNTTMPSASGTFTIPAAVAHQICSAATGRRWRRYPCVTLDVYTTIGPNPLWNTTARPLCNWIGPLTSHNCPGIATSPQFTWFSKAPRAGTPRDGSANALVAAMAADIATVARIVSLIFFTWSLPSPCESWSIVPADRPAG